MLIPNGFAQLSGCADWPGPGLLAGVGTVVRVFRRVCRRCRHRFLAADALASEPAGCTYVGRVGTCRVYCRGLRVRLDHALAAGRFDPELSHAVDALDAEEDAPCDS